jgi:tripartite ATP-independent transporter DctM subunit
MDSSVVTTVVLVVGALVAMLATGVWIFSSILAVSIVGMFALTDFSFARIGSMLQSILWRTSTSFDLAALPLFVWMAEILFRTNLPDRMFRGMGPWVNRVPGRLLHVVVLASGLFGSVAGSSAATCATISKIALPELGRRGYAEGITIGSLAAGGTLGILIPPSIIMVIYAVAAEVSLVKLMLAGFLPGLVLMGLFSGYIGVWSLTVPGGTPAADPPTPLPMRLRLLLDLGPIMTLLVFVFGALLAGWITATECAAWSVLGSLAIAWHSGALNWQTFWQSLRAAMRTSCMIVILVAAAGFMSAFMAIAGVPKAVVGLVAGLGLSSFQLIAMLTFIYILLGIFLEGASMILLTLPIVLPIVIAAGFDPIWFGIFLIVTIEMSELSPPVGFNLFVLQTMTGRDVFFIGLQSLPFFLLMIATVVLITAYPGIVMAVPDWYSRR